jgi:predicted Zn-dependent peptidase
MITETVINMLFEPQFPQDCIDNEKSVVLEEFMMYEDNHNYNFDKEINNVMFKTVDPGLTRPILGTEERIKSFNRDKLVQFHKDHYLTNEKILIISGNVDKKKIITLLENKFKKPIVWNPIYNTSFKELIVNHYKDSNNGINYIDLPIQQCLVMINFRSINQFSDWIMTANILASVLNGGSSSRLFMLLRHKLGLTYYQNAYNNSYKDHGVFTVSFGVRPDGVKTALENVIPSLLNFENVTEYELQKVKNNYETTILYATESKTEVGYAMINYIIDKLDPKKFINVRHAINRVKEKHINNFVKKVFCRENMSVFIGGNVEYIKALNIEI